MPIPRAGMVPKDSERCEAMISRSSARAYQHERCKLRYNGVTWDGKKLCSRHYKLELERQEREDQKNA